ncbi:hypothetical protein SARC_04901 [Sphaeroforma arctica JP610]|uniref:Uncharacterized protein n=1 Tax=Sphaeroforma arctica JP610 TaxID=667725 RepID=A0A0L0G3N4_9EUKA|nr:hypothetical protein SARC_04901 [Sphaeroforma arctica JP610]KNC82818.1 hypothetical protein SARC_04901 [Sphaeroforma arctica JP610]|eukprot:XP_014156720.1 hypothetical protein SARC_04901 [Sphaeroforma arctica JP610]
MPSPSPIKSSRPRLMHLLRMEKDKYKDEACRRPGHWVLGLVESSQQEWVAMLGLLAAVLTQFIQDKGAQLEADSLRVHLLTYA